MFKYSFNWNDSKAMSEFVVFCFSSTPTYSVPNLPGLALDSVTACRHHSNRQNNKHVNKNNDNRT